MSRAFLVFQTATQFPPNNAPVNTSHVHEGIRNDAARQLLKKWREEAQDEATWSDVQQLIEENRLSVRRKFGD